MSVRPLAVFLLFVLLGCGSSSGAAPAAGDAGTTAADAGPITPGPITPGCGRFTTPCAAGGSCEGPQDCVTSLCRSGTCQTPSPADGAKNDGETDVDCGGEKAPACADGKGCLVGADCASGVCTGGVCQPPTHSDGVRNGDETGFDCGGATGPRCAPGQGCRTSADCDAVLCGPDTKLCLAPSHVDGLENGDETGIDCGGPTAPRCGPGQGCVSDSDCNAVLCDVGKTSLCLPASHTDGLKNGDETGIDCGGPTAPSRCATGQGCAAASDCDNVLCDAGNTNLCLSPSHTDGLKNGDETGTDCGGPTAPNRCATGQGCASTSDCDNVLCATATTHLCLPPANDDGLKNGTETDVDCGGGAAPACAVGNQCVAAGDCTSSACNYAGKCVEAPSCTVHHGGDTCGHGEVGQADAAGDSCCKSVPLPDNSARLDKYEITAGRMREFIRAVGNDVQTWVSNHRAQTQQIPDAMVKYLPTGLRSPTQTIMQCTAAGTGCGSTQQTFGVYDHLGNTVILPDRPCANCGQGCWIGSGAGQVGHPTYWWDPTVQAQEFGAAARTFDQQTLDVKSLNCVTPLLLEAFCAWDGGTLATFAQLGANTANSGWGTSTYPWGATPAPKDTTSTMAPNRIPYSINGSYFLVPMPTNYAAAVTYNSTNVNVENAYNPSWPEVRYAWPNIVAPGNDTAFLVAAPGRFANDYRPVPGRGDGYYDIGGNLLEATGDQAGTDNAEHNSWARTLWVGGSFEGHPVGRQYHNLSVMTKYGKMGGRCARPM